MSLDDATSLDRVAQYLVVEAKRGYGSPPDYDTNWQIVWGAKVDRITINHDNRSSEATIWFPELRWHESFDLCWGDMLRIRTDEPKAADRTIVFSGFLTSYLSDFSGGTDQNPAFERNAVVISDYRWLLATTTIIFGQLARSPDDYENYGQDTQAPKDNAYTWLSARRVIFNADGKPNRDHEDLVLTDFCSTPIFADPVIAVPWTAGQMLCFILSPLWNKAYQYLPIPDPANLVGLDHDDWKKVLNHIVIDGLNVIEAVQLICKHLGWGFREDYENDGTGTLVFYKIGAASQYVRDNNATILHRLHAPAVGEIIDDAVGKGKKMLWSMTLAEDIAAVVNNPWGVGSPDQFEITAELVPAWLDTDLIPDTSEKNANLFFIEAEFQEMTAPDSKNYYKYYHLRGSSFLRDVGRKWALNESGRYSPSGTYDRGMPFDFKNVIPAQYILDSDGHRLFAPFSRRLLPCLTVDKTDLNSVGIKVEFSFDGGSTWQVIPSSISSLKDEAGIYIDETNLAELVDKAEGTIDGGDLDGIQLNYWTSLCDDKINSRLFKNKQWHTRIRITASIQLDRRLAQQSQPSSAAGSPFHHLQVYDFSEKYGLAKRTSSSVFSGSDLPAQEIDSNTPANPWLDKHLQAIREVNEGMSISGQFTLERLWLGDGAGKPEFCLGDCIAEITGRDYPLSKSFGGGTVYPEIVQIIYLPDKQMTKLITRDLRFAEITL